MKNVTSSLSLIYKVYEKGFKINIDQNHKRQLAETFSAVQFQVGYHSSEFVHLVLISALPSLNFLLIYFCVLHKYFLWRLDFFMQNMGQKFTDDTKRVSLLPKHTTFCSNNFWETRSLLHFLSLCISHSPFQQSNEWMHSGIFIYWACFITVLLVWFFFFYSYCFTYSEKMQ